jgi:hypothetical protein
LNAEPPHRPGDRSEWPETQYPHVDLCAGGLTYFRNHLKQPRRSPRREELARAVRNVEPSPHVFAWAEEFFAHYAPGEDAQRLASRAQWPFDPDAQEQEREETR